MARGVEAAFERFLAAHPEYEGTQAVDALRASEFGRLDAAGHVYLDYTGSGLYGASQVQRHAEESIIGWSSGAPASGGSRCGPAASATPAPARWRSV